MCLSPFLLASVTLTFSAQVVKHFAVVPPPHPPLRVNVASCVPLCTVGREREWRCGNRMWTESEWAKEQGKGQGLGQGKGQEQGQRPGKEQSKWRGQVPAACCYGYGHGALQRSMVYALRNFRFWLLLVAQRSSDADNCSSRSKNSAHPRCQYPPPSLRSANKPLTLCLPLPHSTATATLWHFLYCCCVRACCCFCFVAAALLCCCAAAAAFDATAGSKFPLNVHFCTSF